MQNSHLRKRLVLMVFLAIFSLSAISLSVVLQPAVAGSCNPYGVCR